MSSSKKITLKSSDGVSFEVDEAVALESQTIKHMIGEYCADNGIPLPNVTSKILAKVIEYCKKHVETPMSDDSSSSADYELKAWDAEFVKVDQATLFNLILVTEQQFQLYLCSNIKNINIMKAHQSMSKIISALISIQEGLEMNMQGWNI